MEYSDSELQSATEYIEHLDKEISKISNKYDILFSNKEKEELALSSSELAKKRELKQLKRLNKKDADGFVLVADNKNLKIAKTKINQQYKKVSTLSSDCQKLQREYDELTEERTRLVKKYGFKHEPEEYDQEIELN